MAKRHAAALNEIANWTTSDLVKVLQNNGFEDCCDTVVSRQIDGELFTALSEANVIFWRLNKQRQRDLLAFSDKVRKNPHKYLLSESAMSRHMPPPVAGPPSERSAKPKTVAAAARRVAPPPAPKPALAGGRHAPPWSRPDGSPAAPREEPAPFPEAFTLAEQLKNTLRERFPEKFAAVATNFSHGFRAASPEASGDEAEFYTNLDTLNAAQDGDFYLEAKPPQGGTSIYDSASDSSAASPEPVRRQQRHRPSTLAYRAPSPHVSGSADEEPMDDYEEPPHIEIVPEQRRPKADPPLPPRDERQAPPMAFENRFFSKPAAEATTSRRSNTPTAASSAAPRHDRGKRMPHLQQKHPAPPGAGPKTRAPIQLPELVPPPFPAPVLGSPASPRDLQDALDDYIPPREVNQKLPSPSLDRGATPGGRRTPTVTNGRQWFHNVDRNEAKRLLVGKPNGTFLFRPSSNAGYECTLVLIQNGQVFNVPVRRRPDGKLAMGKPKDAENSFADLDSLIEYHLTNDLTLFHETGAISGVVLHPGPI